MLCRACCGEEKRFKAANSRTGQPRGYALAVGARDDITYPGARRRDHGPQNAAAPNPNDDDDEDEKDEEDEEQDDEPAVIREPDEDE